MKNILPPPTLPVLPSDETERIRGAIDDVYDNIMVDLATGKYLTRLGGNYDVERPPILFSDDDLWRSIVKVLAFNHRHTRDAVRRVMELLLKPMVSQATVLDRELVRNIVIGHTLDVQSGPNLGQYTIAGVTAHELIFAAGTFGTTPDTGPVTYAVGLGPAPIVGPTIGTQGRIYVASDGTERFVDSTQSFKNTHVEDLLTKRNERFPQYGDVIFEKNSPIEETRKMAFYDRLKSGFLKLKKGTQADLLFTHPKYQPIQSSILAFESSAGDMSLTIQSALTFPANTGPVSAVVAGVDSLVILEGANAGTYPITEVGTHQVTVDSGAGLLTVTGASADNHYKITPVAIPAGSKGTVFGGGGVQNVFAVGPNNFAVFKDIDVTFNTQVDPDTNTSTGYSVRINRGEINEEVIQVESLVSTQLNLVADLSDPTNQTSGLKFPHDVGEVVEIDSLSYSATGTYFITSTTTGGGATNQLDDAAATFLASLLNDTSDVEFLTGANAGLKRTITAVPLATQIQFDSFPVNVGVGDQYRIIKRYSAGNDDVLYLDDTTGLPAANFTVVVDRGTEQEEVLYISTNTITTTPNTLTISNNDIGTAFCASNHSDSITVEAAQVLVLGCDWDIIETRATGEYTIAASEECVPNIDLNSFFLHADVDVTRSGAAQLAVGVSVGDSEFSLPLTGVNSFETHIENSGDRDGILNRSLKFDTGAGTTEEVFATKQKHFTTIAENYTVTGSTTLVVEDSTVFDGLILPISMTISRNNSHPSSVSEIITVNSIDVPTNTLTLAAGLGSFHYEGDPVELSTVVIQTTDVFSNTFAVGNDVSLLYLDTEYRLEDPYNPGTFTEVAGGNLIEPVPNSSYLPVNTTQTKKSIFPGSYTYNLPDADNPIGDQVSATRTKLASGPSGIDVTAAYKIPIKQEIIGSKQGAGLVTLGQDVGPGTTEILVADGSMFPDALQNPYFVVLDHDRDREEVINCVGKVSNPIVATPTNPAYPNAHLLQVDPLEVIQFTHYSRKFVAEQVFDISSVDLQVSKLVVANSAGFGDTGAIFLDYGFADNEKLFYLIEITGTSGLPINLDEITDASKTFKDYYAAGNDALVDAFVVINPDTPATRDVQQVITVVDNTTLQVANNWVPAVILGTPYKIYGLIEVDNSEFGTNLTHVGGDITDIGGSVIVHPKREGGVTQEYVTYSSIEGNVLTLSQPTVFEKAHPKETQVILSAGQTGPNTDGSSYQPFLYSDFLTALFHKDVGNFGSLIKAAGIEVKAEETDA